MNVKKILNEKGGDVVSVAPDETLLNVLQLFKKKLIGFVIVQGDDEKILGTISERDICHAITTTPKNPLSVRAQDIMTNNVVRCTPDDKLIRVMALMTEGRTRHVLVMDGDSLKGLISIGDVMKNQLDETLRDEAEMREFISGTGYS